MKKKLFVLLLTLFAVTAVGVSLPENSMTVQAEELNTEAGNFDYVIFADQTIMITDYTGVAGVTEVVIPAEIDGKMVSSIGDSAFSGCSNLKSITIPDSVTSIGHSAFSGCSSLSSITIPHSVTSIGHSAFSGCNSLSSITLPDSLTSIEGFTFWNCSNLISITLPDSLTSIGDSAFSGCGSLSSITLPDHVTSIGDSAFWGCSSLSSITIPDRVTSIGDLTFYGCSSLSNISISDRVTSIGHSAFSGCSSLSSITIPHSVTSIGDSAFSGCGSLSSITIPDRVTSIGDLTFYGCNSLSSITIPDSMTSIGKFAFLQCSNLKNVYYCGLKEQWNMIDISTDNDELNNAKIHFTVAVPENSDSNIKQNKTIASGNLNLIKTAVTYTGKAQTPAIIVKDANGQVIAASNYDVSYSNNQKVGQATVTVTGKGDYTGTLTENFIIVPKGTSLSKINTTENSFVVKWKKQTKEVTGYQIQYSTNKNFKGAKTLTIKTNKKTSTTVKKLNANKKYYVRIRTYKTVKSNGKSNKLYSDWSNAKNVTTKK